MQHENFRRRILEINSLQEVSKAVVEAARESLVISQAQLLSDKRLYEHLEPILKRSDANSRMPS